MKKHKITILWVIFIIIQILIIINVLTYRLGNILLTLLLALVLSIWGNEE